MGLVCAPAPFRLRSLVVTWGVDTCGTGPGSQRLAYGYGEST